MKLLTILLLSAAAMGISGCRQSTEPDLIVGTGAILGSQAECSSWFLRTDSGGLFELTHLDAEFQHVGLRVYFVVKERNDVATVCMRGATVEVVTMKPL